MRPSIPPALVPLATVLAAVGLAWTGAGRPTSAAPAQGGPDPAGIRIATEIVVGGLQRPVTIAHAGDGSGRLFVVEKNLGRVRIIRDGQLVARPFLDLRTKINANGNEKGFLGIAFHPDYATNGFFYVNYTAAAPTPRPGLDGVTIVERYTVSAADPDVADPASAKLIITYEQPFSNHNGGHLAFGPDGYLYIGAGDGGSGGDPGNRAQNRQELLGKMLRIDVDGGDPYAVPPTNPFVGDARSRPEIWALGLRNPWRYAFDRATGDLYIGDVGQGTLEEIDFQPAGSQGGENYGWRIMEGDRCYNAGTCDRAGLTLPVATYGRSQGVSVTGGEVYRGARHPDLVGLYLYADYGSGNVWGLSRDGEGRWRNAIVGNVGTGTTTFGHDEAGELYLALDNAGEIRRIASLGAGDTATLTPTARPTDPPTPVEPTPTAQPTATPTGSVSPTPTPTATLPPSGLVAPGATPARLDQTFTFTEGPAADARGDVYFSDVRQSQIHKWTWADGRIALHRADTGGSNGLYFDSGGRLVVCESTGQRIVRDDLAGNVAVLVDRFNGQPFNAPNDLWVDPRDGVYFSDPAYGLPAGSLPQDGEHVYYIPPGGGPTVRVTTDLGRPNGIIGTRDGTLLYVADPGRAQILRYRPQRDGTLADRAIFVPDRGADGMTMDERGNVYLANQGVWIYAPDGTLLDRIAVPEAPTNLTFGGPAFRTLFITARTSVFTLEMTVRGAHAPGPANGPWRNFLPLLQKVFGPG